MLLLLCFPPRLQVLDDEISPTLEKLRGERAAYMKVRPRPPIPLRRSI